MTGKCERCGADVKIPDDAIEAEAIAALRQHWYASQPPSCIGAAVIIDGVAHDVYRQERTSRDGRDRIDRLRRRASLLFRRISEKHEAGQESSRDRSELSAIEWSIAKLTKP